jgi:hypothetical protein
MMMKPIRVAIACALSLTAASAMAASSASASITGLTFTLVDLTPDDSNASFYNLQPALGFTGVSVQAKDDVVGTSESFSQTRNQLQWERSLTSTQGNAYAAANSSADGVSANGYANGPLTSFGGSAGTQSYNSANQSSGLTGILLSPHSKLIVTVTASASASAGQAVCSALYDYACPTTDSAQAYAGMFLGYNYASPTAGGGSYSFNEAASASAVADCACYKYVYDPSTNAYHYVMQDPVDRNVNNSRTLTAVFTNDSDFVQKATFGLTATAFGMAMTAVPEPATYALQLLGLLAIGGLKFARRRAV